MLRHYRLKQRLSAYLDGELSEAEVRTLEIHLQRCESCRRELSAVRQGKCSAQHFGKPAWRDSELLWARLQRARNTAAPGMLLLSASRRWKFALRTSFKARAVWAGATIVVASALLLLHLGLQKGRPEARPRPWPSRAGSAFAIDFGLYLDALSKGQEPHEFERRYGSRVTSYEEAMLQTNFDMPASPRMLSAFQLAEVQTLKSGCCYSVQFNCTSNSRRTIIFQQPRDHPASFGPYDLVPTEVNGRRCFRIDAGDWTVLCWDDEVSQYVVMSQLADADLTRALRYLM